MESKTFVDLAINLGSKKAGLRLKILSINEFLSNMVYCIFYSRFLALHIKTPFLNQQ
ncbi:hypothetical protein FM120_16645 [Sphingobacterium faecium PCAi_F2.5]|nr:hypothetical protein FM120_16645 [Sphingobacterium faecium PCAi_F2.5]